VARRRHEIAGRLHALVHLAAHRREQGVLEHVAATMSRYEHVGKGRSAGGARLVDDEVAVVLVARAAPIRTYPGVQQATGTSSSAVMSPGSAAPRGRNGVYSRLLADVCGPTS
jgi:hypothetical protein